MKRIYIMQDGDRPTEHERDCAVLVVDEVGFVVKDRYGLPRKATPEELASARAGTWPMLRARR